MRVLITGSTQGIGLAMASAFVKEGYEVIVHCSSDLEKAKKIKESIGAYDAVTADFSKLDEVKGLYAKTGPVDCLILNASVQYKEKWDEITEEHFDRQITVNLKSTLLLMQAYAPAMKEKGFGRTVTVGSVNQYRRHPELPLYAATKCAVFSLVQNAAKQLASYGVTVNNIAPGAIATPRNAEVYNDGEKRQAVEAAIPMGRFGNAEDCVGAVRMLCSEQGAYITGTDLVIDGGMQL